MIAEKVTAALLAGPSRALGLDPGKTTGWGVVEIAPVSSSPLCARMRERVVAFGTLDDLYPVDHLRKLLREHRPDLVGVEIVARVHPVRRKGVSGISTPHALSLYQAGLLAGRLLTVVEHAGLAVELFAAEHVRAAVAGKATADDAEIERALRLRLADFPAPRSSNNHARDGLAAALYGLLRARLEAARTRRA